MESNENKINKPIVYDKHNDYEGVEPSLNSDYWVMYEGWKDNHKVLLKLPKYFYLERLARDEAFNTLKEYISKAFQYFIDKYSLADSWKLIYNIFWLAYYEMHDYKTPSIAEISKYVNSLELDIHRPDTKELKELFEDLENHNPVLDRYLEKYKIDEQDTAFLTTAFKNSLRNYMTFYLDIKPESTLEIVIHNYKRKRDLVYNSNEGVYLYDVETGEKDILMPKPFKILKIINLEDVSWQHSTEKKYIKYIYEGKLRVKPLNDFKKDMSELNYKGSEDPYRGVNKIITNILTQLTTQYPEYEMRISPSEDIPVGPGIYESNDTLKFYKTLEDGIIPPDKEGLTRVGLVETAISKLKEKGDTFINYTLDMIMKILESFILPQSKVNTALTLAHMGISPFYHVLSRHNRLIKHLMIVGDKGAGKSLKGWILYYAFGPWHTKQGTELFTHAFDFIKYLSLGTLPIYINDVKNVSMSILDNINSASSGSSSPRGTRSQTINEYISKSSIVLTANKIEWEAQPEEGIQDRLIKGRYEVVLFEDRIINLNGEMMKISDLKDFLPNLAPWGLDYLDWIVEDLNNRQFNKGANTLLGLLRKYKLAISELLAEYRDTYGLENSQVRLEELLSEYYFGLKSILTYWKVKAPEVYEAHKEKLDWLFKLENLGNFVDFMIKEWYSYNYNKDILRIILEQIMIIENNDWERKQYGDLIQFKLGEIWITKGFIAKVQEKKLKKTYYSSLRRFTEELSKAIVEAMPSENNMTWRNIFIEIGGKDGNGIVKRYGIGEEGTGTKTGRFLIIPRKYFNLLLYGSEKLEVEDEVITAETIYGQPEKTQQEEKTSEKVEKEKEVNVIVLEEFEVPSQSSYKGEIERIHGHVGDIMKLPIGLAEMLERQRKVNISKKGDDTK